MPAMLGLGKGNYARFAKGYVEAVGEGASTEQIPDEGCQQNERVKR